MPSLSRSLSEEGNTLALVNCKALCFTALFQGGAVVAGGFLVQQKVAFPVCGARQLREEDFSPGAKPGHFPTGKNEML